MTLILFPNNIFEKKFLPKNISKIILVEEEIFFGYREKKYFFNSLKLIFHRASLKYYHDYLKKNLKGISIEYIPFKQARKQSYAKNKDIIVFDVTDHYLLKKLKSKAKSIKILHNPLFLLKVDELEDIYTSSKGKFTHQSFYEKSKKILSSNFPKLKSFTKTYDTQNRKKLPINQKIPKTNLSINSSNKYVKEAEKYVTTQFSRKIGETETFENQRLIFPINHTQSKKWFQSFLKYKFSHFGDYQDAISSTNPFLFHSTISPMLNVGLLTPDYVLKETFKYISLHPVKPNNVEGFIRQIIGWREYQRYTYIFAYSQMKHANTFKHTKKLSVSFYSGNTGIKPLDDAIITAFTYGYLSHIHRLMIVSNLFNLLKIHPNECYKWFMEFSVDSYDWVMIQNVYSMGQWADQGLTMRKPYISSNNYLHTMSNDYSRLDNWNGVWQDLFHSFLKDNRKIMEKTVYKRNLK